MKIEICVGTLEAARIVSKQKIDRIETCIALEQGGLTPSKAMVSWIQNTFHLEQHALIRVRAGGFAYNYDEMVVMRDQILELKDSGITGFVVGALTPDFKLNLEALETWKRTAPQRDFTFHRAFDSIPDWKTAMDQLVKMGFKRILTSGSEQNVSQGIEHLKELVAYANGRIEIMAGGGVKEALISELKASGVDAIHFSGTSAVTVETGTAFEENLLLPDENKLSALLAAIQA
ncbi:copper homeostasis protein CutC [Fluviicola sp.]|uniref:copper homeostasis protein CutC n=1 Tax=Fluviicola sp. TaxID=1917219 RepID=UPI002612B2F7|nr:copper homeostasis protein CutC [Fluviicola sp.]